MVVFVVLVALPTGGRNNPNRQIAEHEGSRNGYLLASTSRDEVSKTEARGGHPASFESQYSDSRLVEHRCPLLGNKQDLKYSLAVLFHPSLLPFWRGEWVKKEDLWRRRAKKSKVDPKVDPPVAADGNLHAPALLHPDDVADIAADRNT